MDWLEVFFALNFSLLLLHEMDAIRTKEWKMFIIFKDMIEQTGYMAFALLHLPLYFWIICTIALGGDGGNTLVYLITDVFLIGHSLIHFFFRKHPENGFRSAYSNILIFSMTVLATVHLLCMLS